MKKKKPTKFAEPFQNVPDEYLIQVILTDWSHIKLMCYLLSLDLQLQEEHKTIF
jgi:hypothetical protein